MMSLAFGLMLLATLGLLVVYLTSHQADCFGGHIMGFLGVVAVVLSVGLVGGEMSDRSDR